MQTIFRILLILIPGLHLPFLMNAQEWQYSVKINAGETPEQISYKAAHLSPSNRQVKWQQMEFTFFIHFGMNTFTNREWGEKGTPATVFNPTALDAAQWALTAKEAGAKLILMVAKHHDGFCLWPSKFTEYSVKNSPWKDGKGDVIADIADACAKFGLKFGIYLSPWDINSPLYGTDEYNIYFTNQLRELLTNYGEVAEVWFDGACGEGPNGKRQVYDWQSYYSLIRELAPQAVIAVMGPDVRWVGTESGYGRETEWSVLPASSAILEQIAASSQKESANAAFKPPGDMMDNDLGSREKILNADGLIWYPSEVDVSIRDGWFYHADQDTTVKTPEKLVDIYFSSVGRNSLLLLNVPPDKRGLFHDNDIKSLKGMRKILDETFQNVIFSDSGFTAGKIFFEYKLNNSTTFDCLLLEEEITKGQRVEKFVLEKMKDKEWVEIIKGTTIGYKRLLRFERTTAEKIRVRILESRAEPVIKTIKLYSSPKQ
ncbi:MAG: alpha-L-fucosidase [Bacteroidales bacterium]